MGKPTYLWRKLTSEQREDLMAWRKRQGLPWHRPPHRASEKTRYHVTAACFEHRHDIGHLAGRMHGRLSHDWNGEEQTHGRQVWCGAAERYMRNDSHFWATINYVHNNPVHHGYVQRWQEWPFSSAGEYLAQMGHEEAARIWREYPVLDYGKGWDDPEL